MVTEGHMFLDSFKYQNALRDVVVYLDFCCRCRVGVVEARRKLATT